MNKLLKFVIIPYIILLILIVIVRDNNFFIRNNSDFLADVNSSELGDVNGDGKVSSQDYVLIRKYLLQSTNFDNNQVQRADINKDGKVSSADYILLKKVIIGEATITDTSKKGQTLTATFVIQDKSVATTTKTSVSCTINEGSTCNIILPTINVKEGYDIIGWNTDKAATTGIGKGGEKIAIKDNATYYSITAKTVKITYNVGEDITGVNKKASSLSFTNNSHTQCINYNSNGCSIKWIPTIISPGNVVHGFAKTSSGEVINVAKTKFTEDTTLYARIYNYSDDDEKITAIKVKQYEVVGNVLVEIENGVSDSTAKKFMKFVKELYRDMPHLFMWNGTVTLNTYTTYVRSYGSDSSGITEHGSPFSKDFSHVALFYYSQGNRTNKDYWLGTLVHELTHAYNYGITWNGGLASAVSGTDDVKNLYLKYKSEKSRPLNSYAYNTASEFYSEAVRVYYYRYRKTNYKDQPYIANASGGWKSDINTVVVKYNKIGTDYYRSIGRIK